MVGNGNVPAPVEHIWTMAGIYLCSKCCGIRPRRESRGPDRGQAGFLSGDERAWARTEELAITVTVGTAVASRPPHRSRRALLTHRALPSGSGVETVTGQWMQYPDRREEAAGDAGELFPAHECTLAASLERLEPAPSHLVEVPPQARAVSGNGIVVQMPFEHPLQPCSGLGNGVVHSFAQLHLDLLQLLQHPLLVRLAPDDERAPFA